MTRDLTEKKKSPQGGYLMLRPPLGIEENCDLFTTFSIIPRYMAIIDQEVHLLDRKFAIYLNSFLFYLAKNYKKLQLYRD